MTASPRGRLATYRAKRNFARTAEPAGGGRRGQAALAYVVQRHDATRLHYDLRLEWDGVMKSWAVTRGPSLDPADKRLAVEVEDHPIAYNEFEGMIPKGQYGGGTVQIWDRGTWTPEDPARVADDLAAGKLKFTLHGERLTGGFTLVRMRPRQADRGRNNWLLIKEQDAEARPGEGDAVLKAETSIVSGRTLAQIAGGDAPRARKKPAAAPAAAKRPAARHAKGGAMPDFIPPMLCKPVDAPPTGSGWLHEIKLDGYRLQLRAEGGTARLRTRTGLDWSERFPALVAAGKGLPDCLIDGEAVVLDADGMPDFAALQAMLAGESRAEPVFFGFDLLFAGGKDQRERTLEQRKAALAKLLPETSSGALRFLTHFNAPGEAVMRSACRMDLEGIVSKRAGSPYRSGRSGDWTKAKCRGREEFVVGAWEADRSGKGIGALLVGTWRDGKLVYVGRVGTGFGEPARKLLLPKLDELARRTSPFVGTQPDRRAAVSRWTEPRLLVEVAYGGWTGQGILRHASYLGVREDKPAREEDEAAPAKPSPQRTGRVVVAGISLSTPDRVLWPAVSGSPEITKRDLARYVEDYADRLLPHLARRPVSILRAPDGIGGQTFFQRHAMKGMSSLIQQVDLTDDTRQPYIYIEDIGGLVALVQMNVVEFHPWGATVDALDTPDRLIFDLDPDVGLDFARVIEAAAEMKRRLEGLGLVPFLKSTGGKGLHVAVPLDARARGAVGWPEAKTFARTVCTMMAQDAPDRFTVTLAKKARGGRIFLDYLRNDRTSTAVAAWSPRGRPGAPVAVPLPWSALRGDLKPGGQKLAELLDGKKPTDQWKDFAKAGVPLAKAIRALTGGTPARRGRR